MNCMNLKVMDLQLFVGRLPQDARIPNWALQSEWFCLTRTDDELSIVCPIQAIPPSTSIVFEGPWRALKILGPLDFSLVGILAKLAAILAAAEISIFAISTYDTDYVLVKENRINTAVACLIKEGYIVIE